MTRYLIIIFLLNCCVGKNHPDPKEQRGKELTTSDTVQYERLKQYYLSSDSVVLLSHHSPNMPIRDPKTGKYFPETIPFIKNGIINYATSVQERKELNKREILELVNILVLPAVKEDFNAACFQPRNAIVAFKKDSFTCFDFCFDCYGLGRYGDFLSNIIMDDEKYKKLLTFYKNHGFKYELE